MVSGGILVLFATCLCCFVACSEVSIDSEGKQSSDLKLEGNVETSTSSSTIKYTGSLPAHATIGATPEICPLRIKCGFQIYDAVTRLPNYPFIKYCNCPKGSFCVKAGENMNQKFYYYRCKTVLEPEDEVMPEVFTTTKSLPNHFDASKIFDAENLNFNVETSTLPTQFDKKEASLTVGNLATTVEDSTIDQVAKTAFASSTDSSTKVIAPNAEDVGEFCTQSAAPDTEDSNPNTEEDLKVTDSDTITVEDASISEDQVGDPDPLSSIVDPFHTIMSKLSLKDEL